MPKNTGRGSRSGAITGRATPPWTDISHFDWEVWSEPEGVAVYEGPKEQATRRRLLTDEEARELARLLIDAAATREGAGT
jgi:hypothetical protein